MSGKIQHSTFKPAWWLRNAHAQTIWPTYLKPDAVPDLKWKEYDVADGDLFRLAWGDQILGRPLVMLIHGLEGTTNSHYARSIMQELTTNGFNSVFMSLRGSGGVPNRFMKSYHSGASDDLRMMLDVMPEIPDAVIGVSLGGNLLLKYLGEEKENTPFKQAIAVSAPYDLSACGDVLETGFATRYSDYLIKELKNSVIKKLPIVSDPIDIDLSNIKSLREFDDKITAPVNGFIDAQDYYTQCSCKPFLTKITTPTLIIHARDDPFMTPDIIPEQHEVSSAVTLEISEKGGHVGFQKGNTLGLSSSWLAPRIVEHLTQVLY